MAKLPKTHEKPMSFIYCWALVIITLDFKRNANQVRIISIHSQIFTKSFKFATSSLFQK